MKQTQNHRNMNTIRSLMNFNYYLYSIIALFCWILYAISFLLQNRLPEFLIAGCLLRIFAQLKYMQMDLRGYK